MTTYNKELQDELDRVTIRGNADKQTIRKLASIIFRMDQRILQLEGKTPEDVQQEEAAAKQAREPEAKPTSKTIKPAKAPAASTEESPAP